MKRTAILKNTPKCETPKRYSDEVLGVSQITEYEGKQFLNIDLFYMGNLRGRYFADVEEKSHAAFVGGKWYSCMINNVARVCKDLDTMKGDSYYFGDDWEFSSEQDKKIALDYLHTYSVTSFESSANQVKYERAYIRKQDRINALMDAVPCVPDQAEEWVRNEVFPGNILFFKKEKQKTTYHCTACGGHSWKKKGWKHGEKTICPKCGQQVTANSRQQERTRNAPVVILQTCGDNWIERQFKAVCRWSGDGKEITLLEQCRAIIKKDECWGKVYYGIHREADEFGQEFWDKNQENKRFMESYLWPGNLSEVLPYGNLEKSGLDIIAEEGRKINVNKFITTFHQRPWMEYLAKAGLSRIVAEVVERYGWWGNPDAINTSAENLREALQLDGNRVYRMKQVNGGLRALEWLQYEMVNNIKISQDTLQYLSQKDVSMRECREILTELKSVNRMVNYMKKQRVSPNSLAAFWGDYLQMARAEGMNTTDDIVRLPKDLKARHDQLVELRNARMDEERRKQEQEKYAKLDKQIEERIPDVARYFWENDNYMIIPAGKCEELEHEGRTLHHCVGSSDIYMRKMAEGRSWILFLRKKETLEKPYYTIEIDMKDDKILQWYSEFDRKPDKEIISKVLEKFKATVKSKQVKTRIRVPVAAIA